MNPNSSPRPAWRTVRTNDTATPRYQRAPSPRPLTRRGALAFSLLELLGTLTVIAILLLALTPALMKQLTIKFKNREAATLKSIMDGVQQYVRSARQIPGSANFAQAVALQMGWLMSDVSTNARGNARVYLVDPALRIGPPPLSPLSTLPYVQSGTGSDKPVNPRVMLITSLGAPLPATITTGATTNAAMFDQIWNSADGAAPSGWSGGENWDDILIQRLNLEPLFVQVILNNSPPAPVGCYSIDNPANPVPLPSIPFSGYFLVGTLLGLHASAGTLQVQQVLQDVPNTNSLTSLPFPGTTFVFDKGVWRGKLFTSIDAGQKRTGVDLQAACDLFLSGPRNVYHTSLTQSQIASDMWSYMSNYVRLAAPTQAYPAGFDPSRKGSVTSAQDTLSDHILEYCNKKASVN